MTPNGWRARATRCCPQAADFWASKATRAANGSYDIDHVTGPDEENPDVNDEAFTTVGAKTTLEDAGAAARVLGVTAPPAWARVAAGLHVTTATSDGQPFHPEFSGYGGQLVKQADVTLLQWPWRFTMPKPVAVGDLDYYVPRTDPGGPSMSDAVNEIDTSALNLPGCASYVYTERSVQPFIRDVFDQFSETRYGGAFTFMTGIGGFLQEFLYGYSGMRLNTGGVTLAPSLTREIGGITLHDVHYRGRVFTVSIGQHVTTLTLQSGAPLTVNGHTVTHTLTMATARPDRTPSSDPLRCQNARASSSEPGDVPLSAVDGSPATGWQPAHLPATYTVPVAHGHTVSEITVNWGRLWPSVTKPNVHPKTGPVATLRADVYLIQASRNGRSWQTLATVRNRTGRLTDRVSIPATRSRYLRLKLLDGSVGGDQGDQDEREPAADHPDPRRPQHELRARRGRGSARLQLPVDVEDSLGGGDDGQPGEHVDRRGEQAEVAE